MIRSDRDDRSRGMCCNKHCTVWPPESVSSEDPDPVPLTDAEGGHRGGFSKVRIPHFLVLLPKNLGAPVRLAPSSIEKYSNTIIWKDSGPRGGLNLKSALSMHLIGAHNVFWHRRRSMVRKSRASRGALCNLAPDTCLVCLRDNTALCKPVTFVKEPMTVGVDRIEICNRSRL